MALSLISYQMHPRLEGHLITNQPKSHVITLYCNIIVTEVIGTLLGDLTVAKK